MATATGGAYERETRQQQVERTPGAGPLGGAKAKMRALGAFWTKINNDAIFNLSAQLAYNFLMSAFPILLVLLAIGGFILGSVSPGSQANLEHSLSSAIPGGGSLFVNVQNNLTKSAGLLLIVGIVIALISGSGLFVTLEWCFGIVFRLRGRSTIRQRVMSIGMLLIYAVLIPIILLASILPATVLRALPFISSTPAFGFLLQAAGDVFSVIVAGILFGITYVVVPNRPVQWKEVWKGTLVAALLLVLYETLFPFYVSIFLKPQNYGSTAGFAVVILIFFYYLGFIVLLGAEINSWASGQRQTSGNIVAILHEVQAHNTTRGAAGPTAGMPQEDLQHHKGAEAMRTPEQAIEHERDDHKDDATPPKFAETGVAAPGYTIEPQSQRDTSAAIAHDPYGTEPRQTSKIANTKDEALDAARSLQPNHPDAGQPTEQSAERSQDARATGRPDEHDAQGPSPVQSARASRVDLGPGSQVFVSPNAVAGLAMARPVSRPLTQPAKRALLGVLAAGAVAVVPVLRMVPDLLRDDDDRKPVRG